MGAGRGFVSETPIRVRYAETDAMGVVHHAAYVVWLEAGRSDWMRQLGSSYSSFEEAGHYLPVTELTLRYNAPARYDERVSVRTWLDELRSRRLRFAYEVVDGAGRALAAGETTHHCTSRQGQVVSIPGAFRSLLARAMVETPPNGKAGRPDAGGAG